jgi:hypothetical protein
MTADEALDCSGKTASVFLDVSARIVAALNRNLVENLDAMLAPIALTYQKNRHDRHRRNSDQPCKSTGGRGGFTEEGHEYCLAALRVLVERDPDQLALFQRLQHGARCGMLSDHVDASSLPHVGH